MSTLSSEKDSGSRLKRRCIITIPRLLYSKTMGIDDVCMMELKEDHMGVMFVCLLIGIVAGMALTQIVLDIHDKRSDR